MPFKLAVSAAIFATMLFRTGQLRKYVFGAAFVTMAAAAALVIVAFGMTLPRELFPGGRFVRWLCVIYITLQIEINSEVTPKGEWVVQQFDRNEDDNRATNRGLVHSVYDDKEVIKALIRWISASTGMTISEQATRLLELTPCPHSGRHSGTFFALV